MKVTIRGTDPVTGDQVKQVIDELNERYMKHGVRVKNLTCYIRFINEDDENIDVVDEFGNSLEQTVTFKRTLTIPKEKKKPSKKADKKKSENVIDYEKQKRILSEKKKTLSKI